MSESKFNRTKKKQLGQFMTPISLSKSLIQERNYKITDKILEPSFGTGSFLIAIIDKLLEVYDNTINIQDKIDRFQSEIDNFTKNKNDNLKKMFNITPQEILEKFSGSIRGLELEIEDLNLLLFLQQRDG